MNELIRENELNLQKVNSIFESAFYETELKEKSILVKGWPLVSIDFQEDLRMMRFMTYAVPKTKSDK